ncbi:hypothetical protein [Pedobacter cryotolerans]|uniref:Lipocalin-like domain-containing protein n=1 Tax=Pedobacter cryotolerans TaxID=2571270 RepID=A0A4U1C0V2_9SPHI|nr:hypothetical protein [Pedobacter cryotolerans]TKB97498.1 hypothetical protein FA045_16195 [Pedobacter cryotolerans]
MRNFKITIILLSIFAVAIYGCKKEEEIAGSEFAKERFIGKWPLKNQVIIEIENFRDTNRNDTIPYLPVDTLVYTADGKYTRRGITVDYTIDAAGENITYNTTPATTWRIKFMRNTSIILTQERTEQVGTNTITTYTEDQLDKK